MGLNETVSSSMQTYFAEHYFNSCENI